MPPLLEDPLAWFDFLASADGTVTKTTLVRAVAAMLPVDAEELASAIDGGLVELKGTQVTAAEFLADGLYGWASRHMDEHVCRCAHGPVPDLPNRGGWFQYWNFAQDGVLTRREALRALLATFDVSTLQCHRVDELREQLDAMWDQWVAEQKQLYGHCSTQGVSLAEFQESFGAKLEECFALSGMTKHAVGAPSDTDADPPTEEQGCQPVIASGEEPPSAVRSVSRSSGSRSLNSGGGDSPVQSTDPSGFAPWPPWVEGNTLADSTMAFDPPGTISDALSSHIFALGDGVLPVVSRAYAAFLEDDVLSQGFVAEFPALVSGPPGAIAEDAVFSEPRIVSL